MKLQKLLICVAAIFMTMSSYEVMAVPANSKPAKFTQPDGSTVTVRLHGDEFFHYATTSDGYNVVYAEDGTFYYAELVDGYKLVATKVVAKDAVLRSAEEKAFLSSRIVKGIHTAAAGQIIRNARAEQAMAMAAYPQPVAGQYRVGQDAGKFKSLIILVNFSDLKFRHTQDNFRNMLNQPGYSAFGGTGSAVDYYKYNSNGKFDPEFVVVGPYTLSKPYKYYGENRNGERSKDMHPGEMVQEACDLAIAAGVNMGDYADGDKLRDIFVFYAGNNEAEGGGQNPNTIWPHRASFQSPWNVGGYKMYAYACTSELRGDTFSTTMAGISTFCHEFGHVMGWPDFYDTDYAANGLSPNLSYYSLMAAGTENNDGCTPPSLSAMERSMKGWITPNEFTSSGEYTVKPVSEDDAYMITTDNPGEYFLIETRASKDSRGPNVWDQALASELGINMPIIMVYHVDQSQNKVAGTTAKKLWNTNSINDYAGHECMKVVRANKTSEKFWGYPGPSNITTLTSSSNSEFKPWSGANLDVEITAIARKGNNISFNLFNGNVPAKYIKETNITDNYAEFEWSSFPHTGSFTVELFSAKNEKLQQFETTQKTATVNSLQAATTYRLKVTAKGGSGESDEIVFKTKSTTAPFPYLLFKESYNTGETIPLRIVGINAAVKSYQWTVDGTAVNTQTIAATKGRHVIMVRVTYSDSNVEIFTKTITVK